MIINLRAAMERAGAAISRLLLRSRWSKVVAACFIGKIATNKPLASFNMSGVDEIERKIPRVGGVWRPRKKGLLHHPQK